MEKKFLTSKNIATLAVLSALIVIIQLISGFIKIGAVNLSFVLIPIVMGAIIIGPLGGIVLGIVFGLVCFIMGLLGMDSLTYLLISQHPVLTFLTCVVKGAMAGLVSALIYKLLNKKNEYLSVILAALAAPVVNTGLFIIGALIMSDTITVFMAANRISVDIIYFLVIMCAGINFLVEFVLNGILAPSLYRVVKYVKTRR
ncbi:MAG: ECF transporter S component [Clostridia bacterium]|nr:ECF transporter S component [Clostridia bacterium]